MGSEMCIRDRYRRSGGEIVVRELSAEQYVAILVSCGRPAAEQRYILAMLRVFAQLPPERREAVRALIACLAETPEEGRALFGVLVQQKTLEAAAGAAGVSPRKLSRLRKKFLEQMPL